MKRTMLLAAIFMCLGIYIWNNFEAASIFAVAVVVASYFGLCIYKKNYGGLVVSVLALVAGFVLINASADAANKKCELFTKESVWVCGKVTEARETVYGQSFDVNHVYTDKNGKKQTIKIRAYLNQRDIWVKYGDKVSFTANLKKPDVGSGFGDYDEQMNLRAKGVLLETTGKLTGLSVDKYEEKGFNIFDFSYKLRRLICGRIDAFFKGETAAVLKGIIIGDDEDISEDVEKSFRDSGISHILVVSGMHVNILFVIMICAFSAFGIGKVKFVIVIQLILVWIFALVTGMGVSTVRAVIVVSVMLMGKLISKEADPLNSLGIAVVVMLLLNPETYFNVGFRLSVLSTGTIIIFANAIKEKLKFIPEGFKETLAVTTSAQIGTLPVISQSFGTIGIYGIITNMIICPTLVTVFAATVIALILGGIPYIGTATIFVVDCVVKGIIALAKWVSSMPGAVAQISRFGQVGLCIYILWCAALKYLLSDLKIPAKRCMLVALILMCTLSGYNLFFTKTHITFLGTGNSDCTILENGNTVIMFDGAGNDNYSVAEMELMPYMRREGIKEIDIAFITHYHTDHIGGIVELIENKKIKSVVLPVGIYKKDFEVYEAAEKAGIPLHYVGNSDKIKIGDILIEGYNSFEGFEENNGFVYFVSYGENRICIPGDTHKDGERILLSNNVNLKSNILKVPHHGSETSGGEEFIKAVSPKYAVVLRGDGELPNDESKSIYKSVNATLYSTYDCGTIRIDLSKNGKNRIHFGRKNFYELRNIKKAD